MTKSALTGAGTDYETEATESEMFQRTRILKKIWKPKKTNIISEIERPQKPSWVPHPVEYRIEKKCYQHTP